MSKNNLSILSKDDLKYLNDTYEITIDDNQSMLFVKPKHYDRTVCHPTNRNFAINSKVKKVTITVEAIEIWKKHFKEYSLFDVQNAINTLIIMYQHPEETNVLEQLKKTDNRIKRKEN